MSLTFGTDGIRGRANTELTASAGLLMGTSAAGVLEAASWIVGRDTRESGSMLEAAFAAGVAATGASIDLLGGGAERRSGLRLPRIGRARSGRDGVP